MARLADGEPPLRGYQDAMLDHPTAGRSLRSYVILTDCPALVGGLRLTDEERFWSRYYWYARFAREWQAAMGDDAGIEQSLFRLLEAGVEHGSASLDALPEVEAAVEQDAVLAQPR